MQVVSEAQNDKRCCSNTSRTKHVLEGITATKELPKKLERVSEDKCWPGKMSATT